MKKILWLLPLFAFLSGAVPEGYYDGTQGLSGSELKTALHDIIDGHVEYTYDFLWTALRASDEDPNNSDNFILLYSGWSISKSSSYPVWNREHSWPKSHGDFGTSAPAGTDMHHLRPTDCDVNSTRGNKDYDEGGSRVIVNAGQTNCYSDGDSFEPRDEVKGDCARMMFYMATRYEGDVSGEPDLELVDYTGTSGSRLGKLSTLLAWHAEDPVDAFEQDRNETVYEYQNNRNPFIDHPEYVSYIWGDVTPDHLDAPQAQIASNVDSTSFRAAWTSVADADGYRLYVAGDMGFSNYIDLYSPKELTLLAETVTGLEPETQYFYKVRAFNESAVSDYSNIISVSTTEHVDTSDIHPPDTAAVYSESFDHFPENGSSYQSGTFTGDQNIQWTYGSCRGDIHINGPTPCLAKGKYPAAFIESSPVPGGISTLNCQYQQAYSSDVNLDLYVNDILVTTLTTSGEQGNVKNSGDIPVNVSGDVVIRFKQSGTSSGQVALDNIAWNTFSTSVTNIPGDFIMGQPYPNPFNPQCSFSIDLASARDIDIFLYDIRGKRCRTVHTGHMPQGRHMLSIDGRGLSAGIYFVGNPAENMEMHKILLLK